MTHSSSIPTTLSDFFTQARLDYTIYNLSRRVYSISRQQFREFEDLNIPWETPVKATAQFALVLRAEHQPVQEAVIWCLALPLDEQGLLIPDGRDALLHRLVEQLGTRPQGEALQDPLKDNPLAFRPDNYTLAALHALAAHTHGLPQSKGVALARTFYAGTLEALTTDDTATSKQKVDWTTLDYQSVADLCFSLTPELEACIAEHLTELPDAPLEALCRMLEHFPAQSEALQQALLERAQKEERHRINILRAILSANTEMAATTLDNLLDESPTVEELAIISAKGWQLLEHEGRLSGYLNALAQEPSFDFIACIKDLAQLSRLRLPVIMMLQRAPDESVLKQRLKTSLAQ